MTNKMKILVSVMLAATFLSGCGKRNNDSNTARSGRGNTGVVTAPNGQTQFTTSANFNPTETKLSGASEDGVLEFLSASMDLETVGRFNPLTDVTMIAEVPTSNGTQINSGQANIAIIVNDEFSQDGSNDKIVISLRSGTGEVTSPGNFKLRFEDEFGVLRVEGTYNNSTVQGRLIFSNKQGPTAGKAEQMLGTFTTPTTGFFR